MRQRNVKECPHTLKNREMQVYQKKFGKRFKRDSPSTLVKLEQSVEVKRYTCIFFLSKRNMRKKNFLCFD